MSPRRHLLTTLLGVTDLVLVLASFAVAAAAAVNGRVDVAALLQQPLTLRDLLCLSAYMIYWHVVLAASGLYGSYRLAAAVREVRDLAVAAAIATAPIVPAAALLGYTPFGPRCAADCWALSVAALALGRRVLRGVGALVRRAGRNLRDVVIAGEGTSALDAARDLASRAGLGFRIAAVIDVSDAGDTADLRARTALRRLEAILDRQPIDEVFLAFPLDRAQPVMARMIWLCQEQGVLVRVLADLRIAAGAWAAADTLLGRPVVTLGNGPADLLLLAVKRGIDVIGACTGLIVLAPALALIAVAIKVDSPGPVIFAQDRIGLNRRRFKAYKFRTMVPNAEGLQARLEERNEARGPVFKIRDDPRVTRLGRWLRATSLDELPQLANVLKGEMSLVGPRPLPVRDVERIDVRWHKRRFSVKPGITCLWQIRSRAPEFDEWIRSDMEYIDNWSLALDLKILAKTLPAVWSRQNAV